MVKTTARRNAGPLDKREPPPAKAGDGFTGKTAEDTV